MLETLANAEITRSANVSNRMLERPTRAMAAMGEGSPVAKTLLDLRGTVEKLDPARQGDLFAPKKFLGILPMGSKMRDYFRGYESSQYHLNAIIESLRRGKDELLRDNASIEVEKTNMWALMGELEKHGYLVRALGNAVEHEVEALQATDPQRARAIQEEVLFTARQKQQDIATQLAVNVQGYMALDLIKRNNAELVKGVDRAPRRRSPRCAPRSSPRKPSPTRSSCSTRSPRCTPPRRISSCRPRRCCRRTRRAFRKARRTRRSTSRS